MPYANNKGTDQPAHPHSLISVLVVHCLDSIIPLVFISEISSLYLASVAVQAGLSLPWSQTPKTGFLVTRLNIIMLLFTVYCFRKVLHLSWGARWLSGRVSDSGARGPGFETYHRRVVSLSKTLYSPKVLVTYPGSDGSVPIWLKKLLTGTLSLNTTNQPKHLS